jgi:hypothetical protein
MQSSQSLAGVASRRRCHWVLGFVAFSVDNRMRDIGAVVLCLVDIKLQQVNLITPNRTACGCTDREVGSRWLRLVDQTPEVAEIFI